MKDLMKSHDIAHKLVTSTLTKDEIDASLEILSKSSYDNDWRNSASCYDIAAPMDISCEITCDLCGAKSELIYDSDYQSFSLKDKYDAIAAEFVELGYQAKCSYYCEKCVAKDPSHLAPITFSFITSGMDEPVISYPCPSHYSDRKYRLALDFLRGADCVGTLTDILVNNPEDSSHEARARFRYAKQISSVIGPEPQHNKPETDDRSEKRSSPFYSLG